LASATTLGQNAVGHLAGFLGGGHQMELVPIFLVPKQSRTLGTDKYAGAAIPPKPPGGEWEPAYPLQEKSQSNHTVVPSEQQRQ
jgi:hypothetical protein